MTQAPRKVFVTNVKGGTLGIPLNPSPGAPGRLSRNAALRAKILDAKLRAQGASCPEIAGAWIDLAASYSARLDRLTGSN